MQVTQQLKIRGTDRIIHTITITISTETEHSINLDSPGMVQSRCQEIS